MSVHEGALGRLPPTDHRHFLRYPITAATLPTTSVPVPVGVNWYGAFDTPIPEDGGWRLPFPTQPWGAIRGGHEVCLLPPRRTDLAGAHEHFDQFAEGACVGFALTRMKSILERKLFDPWWLYREARRVDEWPGEDYDGTSSRAGGEVLRTQGHRRWRDGADVRLGFGIAAYRWARTIDDIAYALDPTTKGKSVLTTGYVTFLNSWGAEYPQYTRIPLATLDRLLFREDGDALIATDQ